MAKITMNDVFGTKPNKVNLKKFFSNPAIEALWWPYNNGSIQRHQSNPFIHTNCVKEFITKQQVEVKYNIIAYFDSLEMGYDFFPNYS